MRGALRVPIPRTLSRPRCVPKRAVQRVTRPRAERERQSSADGSRAMQIEESRYLAELLNAPDPTKKAEELAERLTENFFVVGSTYLEMARKESKPEVAEKLEEVLRIAMKAKNKTLRPEIQLLNSLLDESSWCKRLRLMSGEAALEALKMNDQYFFKLLDRMMRDVENQRESHKKRELLERLQSIHEEASNVISE